MPHAIDALESNAMLWVAHPLVEQLCKTFLQAAGRGSVRAVALGPLARSKVIDASASATSDMRVSGYGGWPELETACLTRKACNPGMRLRLVRTQVVTLAQHVDGHDHSVGVITQQSAILF